MHTASERGTQDDALLSCCTMWGVCFCCVCACVTEICAKMWIPPTFRPYLVFVCFGIGSERMSGTWENYVFCDVILGVFEDNSSLPIEIFAQKVSQRNELKRFLSEPTSIYHPCKSSSQNTHKRPRWYLYKY